MNYTDTYQPPILASAQRAPKKAVLDPNRMLKLGIWAYFFLLIFEGALRRWVLPGLATPLLIIRDPIAIWLLVVTWQRNLLPANPYMGGMIMIGLLGTVSALLLGHGNLTVALYGARILLFHFPLVFVIGRVFNRTDVIKMGRAMTYLAIPMALLIAVQFYSPQAAWVNRGVGGDMAGAGFSGAMGFFRPPGTFSFTNGTHLFFGLAACFVFYFWLHSWLVNRLVLIAATIGVIAAVPFSISRSLLLFVGVALMFTVIGMLRKPQNIGRMLFAIFGMIAVVLLLSQIKVLQTPIAAFTDRFTTAGEVEGGLKGSFGDRYLGSMLNPLASSSQQPFFGYGLGIGTNAGSKLLTGDRAFLISEEEWGRLIGELGPLLGLAVIFIRVSLSIKLALACYRRLIRDDFLPWILLGNGLLIIPQAQWSQPTTLGFSILIAGLIIASLRDEQAPVPAMHS